MTYIGKISNVVSKWMDGSGPESEVVISSRIRLARNLNLIPFPQLLADQEADKVLNNVRLAINHNQYNEKFSCLKFVLLDELTPIEKQILVEKHLVSPQFIYEPKNKAVIINDDQSVSIMINEEDHLRIQCLLSGLQLDKACQLSNDIDDALDESLDFAFCENKGYLTACPTNVGTGLRGSVMLHLPVLVMTNQIGYLFAAISKLGLVVRGFYGEGTGALGNLFQISNQLTMGPSEEEILNNLTGVTRQIIAIEKAGREKLFKENKYHVEDTIYRAFGVLKEARIININETFQLLSEVRLGVDLGIIKSVTAKTLNELMVMTQSAFLHELAGQNMNSFEMEIKRAELIREKLR